MVCPAHVPDGRERNCGSGGDDCVELERANQRVCCGAERVKRSIIQRPQLVGRCSCFFGDGYVRTRTLVWRLSVLVSIGDAKADVSTAGSEGKQYTRS